MSAERRPTNRQSSTGLTLLTPETRGTRTSLLLSKYFCVCKKYSKVYGVSQVNWSSLAIMKNTDRRTCI